MVFSVYAKFYEIPSLTFQDIEKLKHRGRTDGCPDERTDGQRENSIPFTNTICGAIKKLSVYSKFRVALLDPDTEKH